MRSSVRLLCRSLLLAALAAGCSDSLNPSPGVSGLWDFTGAFTGEAINSTCVDSGSIDFHQQGSSVFGAVEFVRTCTYPGSAAYYVSHEIDSLTGTVSGQVVEFSRYALPGGGLLCADSVVVNATGTALSGVGACGVVGGRTTLVAVPGAVISAGTLFPDSVELLTGITRPFIPDFRTAAGMRAYLRPVVWATGSSAVATVSATGVVMAVGAGTTTITATTTGQVATGHVTVPVPAGLTGVGAGNARTCALGSLGDVFCWGVPVAGTPGGPNPMALGGGLHFAGISIGWDFGCGRTAGSAAYCWGAGAFGQLGDGAVVNSATPQAVQGGQLFGSLTAGGDHACGLTAAGAAWCWGSDSSGQLGRNGTGFSAVPVAVQGGITFQSLSAGQSHTCGVATNGALYCWGINMFYQLGDSTTTAHAVPTLVPGGLTWSRVSAASWTTCGLTTAGAAYCWGSAGFGGSLGTGSLIQPVPAPVAGGHVFTSISTGMNHACALDAAGAAWCWGVNSWGQLGNGTTTVATAPSAVTGGLVFATISAGLYDYSDEAINGGTAAHTCAVTTGGTTYCWGVNNIGQVGIGVSGFQPITAPTKVAGQP